MRWLTRLLGGAPAPTAAPYVDNRAMSVRLASLLIATALLAACGRKAPPPESDLIALRALERGTPAISFARPVSVRIEFTIPFLQVDLAEIDKLLKTQRFSFKSHYSQGAAGSKSNVWYLATQTGEFTPDNLNAILRKLRALSAPASKFEWTVTQAS